MNEEFIDKCIINALENKSKCSKSILKLQGMCGTLTKHLYNNLCALENSCCLEIGCWQGASTLSILYKNNINATIIDNWSEFGGSKYVFIKNISHNLNTLDNIQLISENCFHLKTPLKYPPYNIFIYDGSHEDQSHESAITNFWKFLDKKTIIIIDDWSWESVRQNTLLGLKKVNAKILYKRELLNPLGPKGFWNGCCIFLIEK
jgi:hypothetical protein